MTYFIFYGSLLYAIGIVEIRGQDVLSASKGTEYLESIYQTINVTTSKAMEGIRASDLEAAMEDIKNKADEYLNEKSAQVDSQEIVDLVDEVTSQYNQGIIVSTFLEDSLVQEGRKVTAGLYTLIELSRRIKEEDNETLINTQVAAVRYTADALQGIVITAEVIYIYNKDNPNYSYGSKKSWDVTGTFGETILPVFGRAMEYKRQYSAGLGVGYNNGNFNTEASFGYSKGNINAGATLGYGKDGFSAGGSLGYSNNGFNAGAKLGFNNGGANAQGFLGYSKNNLDVGASFGYGNGGFSAGASLIYRFK
ncbi:uncharacterized protein LOC106063371 [Biomphalaria glabrata]|uniref:Uncharacterized protein LOC106063371 n=1 Tax=Biomphalaria glabrata TaxID=6526 RepID=A0A9W3B515_BIOGL|nr:uncharacterized protein LOC106063371 [Biomphalaria glabrata]